jgi:hypothetical protein
LTQRTQRKNAETQRKTERRSSGVVSLVLFDAFVQAPLKN